MNRVQRATFLRSGAALVVGFTMPAPALGRPGSAQLMSNVGAIAVEGWLSIDHTGAVRLYSGKVELGTGTDTALAQLVADELAVPFERVRIIEGITGLTPDQGVTSGSQTIQSGSIPMRQAAATARMKLISLASRRLGIATSDLIAREGYVVPQNGDPSRGVSYGDLIGGKEISDLVGGQELDLSVDPGVTLTGAGGFRSVGRSIKRVDVPEKAYGTFRYVQNVRISGMWHARVVRPERVGATFVSLDRDSVAAIKDVRIVQKGNFVAVAAPSEWNAIRAARMLKVTWSGGGLPEQSGLYASIRRTSPNVKVVQQLGDADAALAAAKKLTASYYWPFQTHGSIGPSCGVAQVNSNGTISVWSGTQGVYPMRNAIAELTGIARESIKLTYVEASGCYGHNGADDAGTDAVLVAQAIGKTVRVQWSRADEHGWDPKGPAMVMDLAGAVGADGTVAAWTLDTYTPTHSTRPGGMAGNLLAGQLTGAPEAKNGTAGGDRNANNKYNFPNTRVSAHWQPAPVLRSSALRGLGSPANCFANESFMDELAHAADRDPIEFRLAHLTDPRARDVLTTVAKLAKWQPYKFRGRGVAFAQYETTAAYVAMIADVEVDRSSGKIRVRDVYVAHDCGLIVNPDGLRNQIEGCVVQGTSRTLHEQVTYDRSGVTSLDWRSYPILRFSDVPNVHIALIDRPAERPMGAGEPATIVVAPAIGNAVFSAIGLRLREVPFTPARVKAAPG